MATGYATESFALSAADKFNSFIRFNSSLSVTNAIDWL